MFGLHDIRNANLQTVFKLEDRHLQGLRGLQRANFELFLEEATLHHLKLEAANQVCCPRSMCFTLHLESKLSALGEVRDQPDRGNVDQRSIVL